MKATIWTLFFCLGSFFLSAQNPYSIKGKIVDTASTVKMVNATIAVLNAKDSTLRKFTRAGADGSFAVSPLGKGKFILLVSYRGYADYVEDFVLDSGQQTT